MTILLVIGIKESARVNNVIVFIKVSILILFIVLGLPLDQARRTGAARSSRSRTSGFTIGWSGICRAAGRRLLRLHRLRRGFHDRAGGQESPARHADRHHRLTGDLHDSLLSGSALC